MHSFLKHKALFRVIVTCVCMLLIYETISFINLRAHNSNKNKRIIASIDIKCLRNVIDQYVEQTKQEPTSITDLLKFRDQFRYESQSDLYEFRDYERAFSGIDPWNNRYVLTTVSRKPSGERIKVYSHGQDRSTKKDDIIYWWP